jgi:hypothetical protein
MAQHRRAQGLLCISINWGPWSEVGMAANMGEVAFESMGLVLVDPKHVSDCRGPCHVAEVPPTL